MELAEVLDRYAHRCANAPLDHFPLTWAIHLRGDHNLGEYGWPYIGDATVLGACLIPFGTTRVVSQSFVVMDTHPHELHRHLYITEMRLEPRPDINAVRTLHYAVSYALDDWGRLGFGIPEKTLYYMPGMDTTTEQVILDRLRGEEHPFDVAFRAGILVLEALSP